VGVDEQAPTRQGRVSPADRRRAAPSRPPRAHPQGSMDRAMDIAMLISDQKEDPDAVAGRRVHQGPSNQGPSNQGPSNQGPLSPFPRTSPFRARVPATGLARDIQPGPLEQNIPLRLRFQSDLRWIPQSERYIYYSIIVGPTVAAGEGADWGIVDSQDRCP